MRTIHASIIFALAGSILFGTASAAPGTDLAPDYLVPQTRISFNGTVVTDDET